MLSMDEPSKEPISIDTIVEEISCNIQPRCDYNLLSLITGTPTPWTFEEALAIITSVNTQFIKKYPDEKRTSEIFDALYKINRPFKEAIKLLQAYAQKNLDLLTGETLTTIENSDADQPISELNALPSPFKKYVMQRTLDDYNDTSEIVFAEHYNSITAFDICAVTHRAATGDYAGRFHFWDLTDAQSIHTFKDEDDIEQICFTDDGSLIAFRSNKTVKIWNPETKQLCYTLPLHQNTLPIYHMCYAQSTQKKFLTIFSRNITIEGASTWLIHKKKNKFLCFHQDVEHTSTQPLTIEKGIYSFENPRCQFNSTKAYVTKKSSHPLLLCKLAAQQTRQTEDLTKIFSSLSHQQLTLGDSNILYNELKKNPCFSKNTQPTTIIENTKKQTETNIKI